MCDSILQFVGGGIPVAGTPDEAAAEQIRDGKTSDTRDNVHTGSPAGRAIAKQPLQKHGLMQAFMGNKVRHVCVHKKEVCEIML